MYKTKSELIAEKGLDVFKTLKFLKKKDFHNQDRMNRHFLMLADDILEEVGIPIIITADFATNGHASRSPHYLGKAIDFIPKQKADDFQIDKFIELGIGIYEAAKRKNIIIGLGFYPFWKNIKTGEPLPGLHLDNANRNGRSTYWVRDKHYKYIYNYDFNAILDMTKRYVG